MASPRATAPTSEDGPLEIAGAARDGTVAARECNVPHAMLEHLVRDPVLGQHLVVLHTPSTIQRLWLSAGMDAVAPWAPVVRFSYVRSQVGRVLDLEAGHWQDHVGECVLRGRGLGKDLDGRDRPRRLLRCGRRSTHKISTPTI